MRMIGAMAMPADFQYRDVALRGRPRHERTDAFRARHPQMDVGRRAKIFAPFDALKGFSAALAEEGRAAALEEPGGNKDADRASGNRPPETDWNQILKVELSRMPAEVEW